MKKYILLALAVLLGAFAASAQTVYSVSYKSDADVKVYVAEYKSDADLVVYKCDYKSDADLIIYFAEYKSDAGWRNKEKQHLMY